MIIESFNIWSLTSYTRIKLLPKDNKAEQKKTQFEYTQKINMQSIHYGKKRKEMKTKQNERKKFNEMEAN